MRNFRRSANSLNRTLRTLSRGLLFLGGPLAAAGLTQLARAGIESGDQLAKTAQKLGVAVDEMEGLRFAAELTGVQMNQLDLGLQRMTRRVAEAAQGTGEAQAALKELGLDARALARLNPDEQFRRVAEAFEQVGTQSDKVRLGFKLFDSEGVALINTLELGKDQLGEFADEARQLGLALQPRQLKVIQEAADAGTVLDKSFTGLSRQLGATFAPAITQAREATARFVQNITQSLPTWAAWGAAIIGVERNLKNLTLTELNAELKVTRDRVGDLVDKRDEILDRRTRQNFNANFIPGVTDRAELDRTIEGIEKLTARYNEIRDEIAKLEAQSVKAQEGGSLVLFNGPPPEAVQRLQNLQDRWREMSKDLENFIQKERELESFGESITENMLTPVERFTQQITLAREALDKDVISQTTFDRYNRFLSQQLIPSVEKAEEASNQLALTFTSAFEDAIVEGRKLRDVLEGIYKDILRIFIRKSITEPIGNFLGGLFGGGPTRHIGGSVSAGRPYTTIPGEVFVPGEKGSVIPSRRMGGASVTFHQYNDFSGVDEASVYSRIVPALGQTKDAAVAEVRQLMNEGRL